MILGFDPKEKARSEKARAKAKENRRKWGKDRNHYQRTAPGFRILGRARPSAWIGMSDKGADGPVTSK